MKCREENTETWFPDVTSARRGVVAPTGPQARNRKVGIVKSAVSVLDDGTFRNVGVYLRSPKLANRS